MKPMRFVSFHTHSTYSYGDGYGTVAEHVARVKSLGMTALALSEHGNVNSHVALERKCNEAQIKPIFGIEAYFSPPKTKQKFHITLFARNDEGYRNLNKIVTQSYLDAYQYPTVSWENLVKNNAGIAAFSGCSDSLISCTLLGGKSLGEKRLEFSEQDYKATKRRIQQFQELYKEFFYLEVQRFPGLERTRILNPAFAQLAEETGAWLIGTADVHYPYGSDNAMQKVLHAARRSSTVAVTEASWEYDIELTYPVNDEQIQRHLEQTGLTEFEAYCAVDNTRILAEECNVELPKAKPLRFPLPDGYKNSEHYLKKEIVAGLSKRLAHRPDMKARLKDYKERINHELKIIVEKDFCDYFLVVADLVQWAKEQGITVGPGRGSAAGSLICYIIGITEIDPIHNLFDKMVFERFIDPNRSDMPDIDLDFDDSKRHMIAERAREVYGQENVANVANHTKYRGRKALQDVARAYGISLKTFDPIGQRCTIRVETDDRVDDSILDTLKSFADDPAIASLVDQYGNILNQAIKLEGNQHSMGIHAGGFVISSDPIPNVCAIYSKNKGTGRNTEIAQVIPYEKRDAEYLGMLKMDFLGLTTCGMLGLCLDWSGVSLETLYSVFYQDWLTGRLKTAEILDRFRADDVVGLFQYEGGTTRQVVKDVLPENFDELAACGALSRPGPYYGGQTSEYIAVKRGDKDWERIHPNFDKHVEWTYGQIVYQEQIMWILRDFAGFDTATVLRVRKIIGKKLGEHQFAELWDQFRSGVLRRSGVEEDAARRIWGAITTAAGYAFNTAHAYSYALIAWWQMWFKINYPAVFFAASLAKNGDGKDNLPRRVLLLQDAVDHGLKILPVDVNQSWESWVPVHGKGALRPGFSQIDGIGEATASDIVTWRDQVGTSKAWLDWDDISAIKGIGAKTIQKIKDFVDQDDPFGVHKTQKQLTAFRIQAVRGDFLDYGIPGEEWFYSSNELPDADQYVAFVGFAKNVVFRDEVETIRTRTGKSVEQILSEMDFSDKTRKATIFAHDEFGEVALRLSRFVYPSVEYKLAAIKPDHHIVVAYGRTFKDRPNSVQVKNIWVLEPD